MVSQNQKFSEPSENRINPTPEYFLESKQLPRLRKTIPKGMKPAREYSVEQTSSTSPHWMVRSRTFVPKSCFFFQTHKGRQELQECMLEVVIDHTIDFLTKKN